MLKGTPVEWYINVWYREGKHILLQNVQKLSPNFSGEWEKLLEKKLIYTSSGILEKETVTLMNLEVYDGEGTSSYKMKGRNY